MGRSIKVRVAIGAAAMALLLAVLVGMATDTSFAGSMTTASLTWCRTCV